MKNIVMLLLLSIFFTFNSQRACAVIVNCGYASIVQPANIDYDPTSPTDTFTTLTVRITEQGGDTYNNISSVCNIPYDSKIFIWNQNNDNNPNIQGLNYEILAPNGVNIAHGSKPAGIPSRHYAESVSDSVTWVNMQVRIPAGQSVPSRLKTDFVEYDRRLIRRDCTSLDITWNGTTNFKTYGDCGLFFMVEEIRSIPINVNVAETMSVNIAGGATTRTFDFGPLSSGGKQNVNIQARSSAPFKISFISDMDGVLKLGGNAASSLEIPYTATLDGNLIDAGTPYENADPNGTNGLDVNLPFEVTIGDTSNKRAGTYSDIITLRIENLL